VELPPLIFRVV